MGYWTEPKRVPTKQKQCKICPKWIEAGITHICSITRMETECDFTCNMCSHDKYDVIDSGFDYGDWMEYRCSNCGATRIGYYSHRNSHLGD